MRHAPFIADPLFMSVILLVILSIVHTAPTSHKFSPASKESTQERSASDHAAHKHGSRSVRHKEAKDAARSVHLTDEAIEAAPSEKQKAHHKKAAMETAPTEKQKAHHKKDEIASRRAKVAHAASKSDHVTKKTAGSDRTVSKKAHSKQKKSKAEGSANQKKSTSGHQNKKKAAKAQSTQHGAHSNEKKTEAAHSAPANGHQNKKTSGGAHHASQRNAHDNKHKSEALQSRHNEKPAHDSLRESCEELINHGTHFTVVLDVGTPAQKFNVVADTGSDAILIPSCQCVENNYCSNESNCFTGTNVSDSFSYKKDKKGAPLNSIKMMFGSGPVEAVVASDKVRVGNVKVTMNDSILLMTDHMLNIKGPFEGILGLGLPASSVKAGLYRKKGSSESSEENLSSKERTMTSGRMKSTGVARNSAKYSQSSQSEEHDAGKGWSERDGPVVDYSPMMNIAWPDTVVQVESSASLIQVTRPTKGKANSASSAHEDTLPNRHDVSKSSNGKNESEGIIVKGFAENAGIDRFSMCFNDGAPGVLRLQSQKAELSHGSVGQVHWGLDFRGISIGDKKVPVKMCQEMDKKSQTSPCGAIPDSGTTVLMGPKDHIVELFESICDGWDRCKKNHTAFLKAQKAAHEAAVKEYNVDPFELQNATKGMIFQMLLMDCHSWWVNGTGLDELPDLHFQIRGVKGTKQTLQLHGWSYVIETYDKDYETIYKEIDGVGTMPVGKNYTGGSHKVCSPAFSTMDYQTEKNGPVWILGTPIFYEYQVGYDYKASPPAISFTDTECGTCDSKKKTSLTAVDSDSKIHIEGQTTSSSGLSHGRRPRQVFGKLRMPSIDKTLPL